ncbi:hypothetical protein RA307_31380 [Xanthobacteraceae bacterium Astr-EGSB]|uniref:phage major capsid protein n=1 Tax=Astrobacterium formosum TaxID=3069710 RepID=UPI0027B6DA33|nr:hypothetical protein [Xanthobacteraceae bacterium Astr-EGSB]
MKVFKIAAVAFVVLACAAALLFVGAPDSVAAVTHDPLMILANPALLALRAQHADLVGRAAAKLAEVKDGTPAADVTRIETEHAALIREASEVQTRIAVEERAAPSPQVPTAPIAPENEQRAHAWTATDIAAIQARASAFGLSADQALTVMADTGVRSVEAATDRLQNLVAARQAPRNNPHLQVTRDEGDTLRTAVESAIMLRANPQALAANAPEREMARSWRGMSLMETGRLFVEETRGVRLRGMGRMEMAGALLGLDTLRSRAAGMHSTSDFASLLANVAAKRLRTAYAAAPQTFKPFCRQSNNPDFKEKSVVQLSAAPAFKKVREGQEFSYGGLSDGVEKYALATFGRIIAITRQTLINDDLGAFDRIPTMIGRAAADLESTTVYSVLLDNPNMGDGTALFHADHGNLRTGTVIDETNLALADKGIREQRGFAAKAADREYLNLLPKFLLTGTAYRIAAQKMVTAVTPTATSGVNVFQNALEPITEQRITGNKWFLIADPAQIDTIEYAYLEGEEGVFTEERVGFEVDGIQVKGRLDFAAKAIDWRGLQYNPGA